MNHKHLVASSLVSLLLFLVLSGCLQADNSFLLENTTWKYVRTRSQQVQPVIGSDTAIVFSKNEITGNDGCNDYWGSYEIGGNDSIHFGSLEHTLALCSIVEEDSVMDETQELEIDTEAFLNLLEQVEYYEVKNDLLWLYFDKASTDVMIFERVTPSN